MFIRAAAFLGSNTAMKTMQLPHTIIGLFASSNERQPVSRLLLNNVSVGNRLLF